MSSPNYELSAAVAGQLKKATRGGHVVLTRGGKPVAYILPTSIYDEEDIGYMTDPNFWKKVREWRADTRPTVPLEQVLKELNEKQPHDATAVKKTPRVGSKRKTQHAAS